MKKAAVIGLLCLVFLQILQTASSKDINVAYKRPVQTNLKSHQSNGDAREAVDDDKPGKETCFESLNKFKNPWLQIDLGKNLWVENVQIKSKKNLSNIDIRIGNRDANLTSNPLCLKSRRIPRLTPTSFSCAEPMLGRYVFIAAKDYFQLCDVKVFLNADAMDKNIKYLVNNNRNDKEMLEKGQYNFRDHSPDEVSAAIDLVDPPRKVRMDRKDLVIDLPPRTESLTFNAAVLIPMKQRKDSHKDKCTSNRGKSKQKYIKGAVGKVQDTGVVTIKTRYTTLSNEKRNHTFQCIRIDVRMKGDICRLKNKCGDLHGSKCDTKFISPLFPPGSYYCKCNPGFVSSSSTKLPIENYVLPGEKCIKGRPPQIWHSKQNLALLKKVIASSTDNLEGCGKEKCKQKEAFPRFVVDGDPRTCFRSHTEDKPWLIVYLGDLQPVSLVRIQSAEKQTKKRNTGLKDVGIFVGDGNHFMKCAVVKLLVDGKETSYGCNSELYVFGNSVKITTKAPVLRLCEVEVYANSYGNIIGTKQQSYGPATSRFAIDRDASTCFKAKTGRDRFWSVNLGENVRVARVFMLFHGKFEWKNTSIDIDTKVCFVTNAYGARKGNYFDCNQPVTGSRMLIRWPSKYIDNIQLCEVEVFQTKIINLAGKRPTKSSTNEKESYRGCDQKLDKPFSTGVKSRSKQIKWWSVDLIALCKIHLVRIVTASGYKPQHLKGLKIQADAGENAFGKGRHVASLDSPTKEPVQTITLRKNIKARFITLALSNKRLELQFREVEIYNGPLLAIDDCRRPNICPKNFKCVNGKKSYKCVCPDGFRKIGSKKCEDIDECKNDICDKNAKCKNIQGSYSCTCKKGFRGNGSSCSEVKECIPPCDADNSFCDKSFESYVCKCPYGFNPSFSQNGTLLHCEDVNECENPMSNICGNTSTCVNARGFYNCTCRNGYELDKRGLKFECKEVKECIPPCDADNSFCDKSFESYVCKCPYGFNPSFGQNGTLLHCEDVNECENPISNRCGNTSTCVNARGFYNCTCKSGYVLDKRGLKFECKDIDECAIKTSCHVKASCSNTPGSYKCTCSHGLGGDGYKSCLPLPRCSNGTCKENAICKDFNSTDVCDCKGGYHFNGKICVDINECKQGAKCVENSECVNAGGSYDCACASGYSGDGKYICEDIDECKNDTCDKNAECKNIQGSYSCTCKKGFQGNGSSCSDINECKTERACGENEECVNNKGSFLCNCKNGYHRNPPSEKCKDINECKTERACGENAECVNNKGSFLCNCKNGYHGNPPSEKCEDIDECEENTYDCPKFSRCTNRNSGYECLCKDGYRQESDGTCSDVNECENPMSNRCGNTSTCVNARGFYNCTCKSGYVLDKRGLKFECKDFLRSSGVSFYSRVLSFRTALLRSLVLLGLVVCL